MKLTQYPDPTLQEAIEWMVLLRSGEATNEDYQRYKRWRYADVHHDAICAKIEITLGKIDSLTHTMPPKNVRQTLLAPSSRRKFLHNTLGIAIMAMFSGLAINQKYPVPYLLSDYHTDTAQRRHIELGDGSTLDMNARTALNITINDTLRNVDLRTGGIIVSAVNDTRPFSVYTNMGRILTGEARFHLRQENGGFHLAVLESVVKVIFRRGDSQRVEAGHGLWFNKDKLMPVGISPDMETAWIHGRLEVTDTPLRSVIASLKNYSSAFIHLDPTVANLRVSGNFPLDDVPYALDALAQTMPIAITRTTGYWIHVTSAVA